MKDSRLSKSIIVFIIITTVITVCYVYFAIPFFQERINSNRAENKQIEYDLEQIEAMGGNTDDIIGNIKTGKAELEEYEISANTDSTGIDMDIAGNAEDAGLKISEIEVEDPEVIGEKNVTGKILNRQTMTVTFESGFSEGVEFMKELEKSDKGIYRIKDFLFSSENTEKWMIIIDAYYYEER